MKDPAGWLDLRPADLPTLILPALLFVALAFWWSYGS